MTAAHLNLAGLFGDMGRLDDALARTVSALKLFPRDARVRKMLGISGKDKGWSIKISKDGEDVTIKSDN